MKIEVHPQGGTRRVIEIEAGATKGATVGVNVWNQDGSLFVPAAVTPETGGPPITYWRLILEIPPNVVALAETTTTGLYVITGAGTSETRTIAPVAGETTVANGSGVAGDPTVGLADVANSGAGALLAITRDGKGRVTGAKAATITGTAGQVEVADGNAVAGLPTISLADVTPTPGGTLQRYGFDAKGRRREEEAADTDDLAEGSANLYFTDERAQDAVGAVADDSGDVELHYETSPARRLWAVLSSAVQSALSAAVSALQPGDDVSKLTNDAGYLTDAPSDGDIYGRKDGAWEQITTSGSGTVTSVGLSVPTGFQVSGSPVTTSGTLTVNYDTGYQGYTSAEASKLSGIAAGATVGADWPANLANIPANITAWAAVAPADKVGVSGDTMTGDLQIEYSATTALGSPTLVISNTSATGTNQANIDLRSNGESALLFWRASDRNFGFYLTDGNTASTRLRWSAATNNWDVNGGATLSVAGQMVAIDSDVVKVTGAQTVGGIKTLTDRLTVNANLAGVISFTSGSGINYIQAGADATNGSWQEMRFSPYGSGTYHLRITAAGEVQTAGGNRVWDAGNLADTSWATPSLGSNWTGTNHGYKRFGAHVSIRGDIANTGGSRTPGTVIFTLPAGFRPSVDMVFGVTTLLTGGGTVLTRIGIPTSGAVTIADAVAGGATLYMSGIAFYNN